jgi:5-methylthioadenosine/S-adenosylhomocysteine deaminase
MTRKSIMKRRTFLAAAGVAAGAILTGRTGLRSAMAQAPGLPARGEFTIRNAIVLTMDATLGDFRDGDIHVRDGQIVAVGPGLAGGGASIDGSGFIAMPGLIDTHQHMWTSIFRGLVGETLEISYFAARAKLGPSFTPEHMYRAVRLAMVQAINSGVTTSNNMHHNVRGPEHADATIKAQLDVGQRGCFSYGVAELQPRDKEIDFADIARIKRSLAAGLGEGLISLGTFLRSPVETSDDLFRSEYRQARALDILVALDGPQQQTGSPAIRKLNELGCLGPKMLLVHSPDTEKSDRQLLAANGVSVSSSPFTEMAGLAVGTAAIDMTNDGVNVSLSIDTTGSPNDSNLFTVARLVMNLGRLAAKSPVGFNYKTALQMATVNGARALGILDRVGSLVPNKRADIILVRTASLNMNPAANLNPYRLLVGAQSEDIDTVVVDGRILKRGGKLVAIDSDRVIREAAAALGELRQKVGWPS